MGIVYHLLKALSTVFRFRAVKNSLPSLFIYAVKNVYRLRLGITLLSNAVSDTQTVLFVWLPYEITLLSNLNFRVKRHYTLCIPYGISVYFTQIHVYYIRVFVLKQFNLPVAQKNNANTIISGALCQMPI